MPPCDSRNRLIRKTQYGVSRGLPPCSSRFVPESSWWRAWLTNRAARPAPAPIDLPVEFVVRRLGKELSDQHIRTFSKRLASASRAYTRVCCGLRCLVACDEGYLHQGRFGRRSWPSDRIRGDYSHCPAAARGRSSGEPYATVSSPCPGRADGARFHRGLQLLVRERDASQDASEQMSQIILP